MTWKPRPDAGPPSPWIDSAASAPTRPPVAARSVMQGPTPSSLSRVNRTSAPFSRSTLASRFARSQVKACSVNPPAVVVPVVSQALRPFPTKTCLLICSGWSAFPPLCPGSSTITLPWTGAPSEDGGEGSGAGDSSSPPPDDPHAASTTRHNTTTTARTLPMPRLPPRRPEPRGESAPQSPRSDYRRGPRWPVAPAQPYRSGVLLRDLDQIAAGVVEHGAGHRAHVHRLLGEVHAEGAETLVLGLHVVDGERGERDAVGDQRLLERLRRRVAAGFEHQLRAAGVLGGHHGQPPGLAHRDVALLHEPQDVGVEPQRLLLVVNHHARQVDLHSGLLPRR